MIHYRNGLGKGKPPGGNSEIGQNGPKLSKLGLRKLKIGQKWSVSGPNVHSVDRKSLTNVSPYSNFPSDPLVLKPSQVRQIVTINNTDIVLYSKVY